MIAENIARVRGCIAEACARANRPPDSVTLIAVSKTHPPDRIAEAVEAGLRHFGESRVEEAQVKIPQVAHLTGQPLHWHMIGQVQSRKAKGVAPLFGTVHSVDSVRLAHKLSQAAQAQGVRLDVLLEMNISGEASKAGFAASAWSDQTPVREALWQAVGEIIALPALNVRGLMTIAPYTDDEQVIRPVFRGLRQLRDALSDSLGIALPHLSMGMTDDYPIAIEEGATIVRIGRAIFGERVTPG